VKWCGLCVDGRGGRGEGGLRRYYFQRILSSRNAFYSIDIYTHHLYHDPLFSEMSVLLDSSLPLLDIFLLYQRTLFLTLHVPLSLPHLSLTHAHTHHHPFCHHQHHSPSSYQSYTPHPHTFHSNPHRHHSTSLHFAIYSG